MTGIEAIYVDSDTFTVDGNLTDVFIIGRQAKLDCGSDGFKFSKILSATWANDKTTVNLTTGVLTSNLNQAWYEPEPHMADGRPIVRADTRPIDSETYFTCAGDNVGIGDGKHLVLDFRNDDDLYTGSEVPSGMKCKQVLLTFNCPVHLKDGTLYFFNAPFGSYIDMDIVVPSGSYYPNPTGSIPASALGLTGEEMYAYASQDTPFQRYVNHHHIHDDCAMGDELNAEGAAVNAVPIGWYVRGLIFTPEEDTGSYGYGSLEMYRCHTILLPGQTLQNIH